MTDVKLALVTGASRGIGMAIALALGEAGHIVVGTATTANGAEHINAIFADRNIKGLGVVLDVRKAADVEAVLERIKTDYDLPVSILINNAGITRDNLLLRLKDEDWDDVIDTNLSGVFRVTKPCLKGMLKARWGRIVNISSISGVMGNPGQCNYSAAKAGVIAFTKSLAKEIASRGITVNAVAPGYVKSDMTDMFTEEQRAVIDTQIPVGRFGTVEEIAQVVMFLVSPGASYVTGQTLNVNGGLFTA